MEQSGGGKIKNSWHRNEFIDLVLSWSLQEIFDENLYKYQVEEIPESFESVDTYLGSYVYPLLEETRAELASAMEIVDKAPVAEVTSFFESKNENLVYNVIVDHWMNRTSDRGSEPYRTLPGDFVLFSDSKPESASDLLRAFWTYTFASVVTIDEDENGDNITSLKFKVKSAMDIELVAKGQSKSLYVVYLTNITTNKRIWNSLRMRQNLNIIKKVLCKNTLAEEKCEICPVKSNSEVEKRIGSTLLSMLNESQIEAILASLLKIECNHKSSVELIWGPPGTGKTTTISILLYALLKTNVRTLVCAPTNVAITELASRVVALVRNSVEDEPRKSISSHSLGEILIFGNKDRLKVGSDIEEIFLDYRLKRLVELFVPLTGWKHCIASMVDFFEDCVFQHRVYMDNEMIKATEGLHDEVQKFEPKSFLEFARGRFKHVIRPLRTCLLTFLTHLPSSLMREENIERIMQLMRFLDGIEEYLFEDSSVTSQELECIFSKPVTHNADLYVDKSSLLFMRSWCVTTLRLLRDSVDHEFRLPIGTDIPKTTQFIYQNASLIFCTTSTSYKLHTISTEPFNFVVIDEAAQVKECESIIAFQIPDVRHAILVGDECQLPATVSSEVSEDAEYGRSLFERLSSLGHSKHLLNMQYRMHPAISCFPNSNFYLKQILDAPNVQSESYNRCYLEGAMFGPYSFINIRGGKEELDDVGHSRRNLVEVAVVVTLVHKLFKAWSNGSQDKLSIGLISPYAAQVVAIRDKLQQRYENIARFTIKVKAIDGFQGGEEDVIIISTVRSNRGGSVGFLSSPQRTNVALTRARHCLWILGNERTLQKSDSVWEALILDAKNRGCFFNGDEDSDIGKTIIDVKKELQDLGDLLSGESILFKNSRWKVLFSENFRKSFLKLKLPNVKKLVIHVLLKIASGWRPKKINVDVTCESSSYIVKQFKVEKYHVVCSIDIVKDSIYEQVLKVWDVLPMAESPKLFKRLDSLFVMYTDDFINHCNKKCFMRNLEVPKSWSTSKEIIRFKNLNSNNLDSGASSSAVNSRSYVENSKVSESLLLMKFYSLSSGFVNHLFSDLDGREVSLPFEVTDEEREIIVFPKSSFILGRSGTGKTTILTIKLYRKIQEYYLASRDSVVAENSVNIGNKFDVLGQSELQSESPGANLHQLFVTVSPKLCYAIKKHVSQLKSFASGKIGNSNLTDMDDVDEMAEFQDIPDTFVGISQEKYPLIITFHKFLMMLDGTLGNSYFYRFHGLRDSCQYEGRRSIALQTFIRKNEVTYDHFRSVYWPHFNAKLTKNLDPSGVFTEIMSHIKGSVQGGETCESKRSEHDYVSLSDSRVSTLSEEKRETIYRIFEDYEKMKLERGEFDLADFVIDIHLRLKNENLLGDKMDFVYIDEVQDLTMRQISLFRCVCNNVDEGFVFSGDTAQTIARGIDFRFEDIRSLFYNEFVMKSENHEFSGRREKGLISDIFCLSQNFRTHNGVLRLAQSIIDLICYFFPQSIDVLAPETSLIYGELPVVLEPGTDENSIITIFGHSGNAGTKWIGFGADQVILVRDDATKKEISECIGHQALILTIVECKGLEFQDVLLYNFFGSSPMRNQWRVLYEFLKEKEFLDANSAKSFPSFSQSRHNILCSELKQLYVAITRTKQRLWICENNEELSEPMLDYWKRLCLVQIRKIDDSLAEAMQRASSPEEWKLQGVKLFWEKNYEMATLCFEKAGYETWEKRAKASGLRAAANNLRGSNSEEARVMLREAAEIFDSIGRADSAAECFCDVGEYERAGKIYLEKCGKSELSKAGECFSLAGRYETAAEVYARGNFFSECLSACTKGNIFDLGLQYIDYWKQQATYNSLVLTQFKEIDKIAQEFLEKCALECHARNDNASLMKFVRAFHTLEAKRNFLMSLDCLEGLLMLEEESKNFKEAAEIAKRVGDTLREIDLMEKAKAFEKASLLVICYVLSNSVWASRSEGWPLKSFPQKDELLKKAISLAQKVSESFHASTRAEVDVLSHDSKNLSELMKCYVASKQYGTLIGEVLSARKLLDAHFQVHPAKYGSETESSFDLMLFNEVISKNRVSWGTLVYVWNLWKAHSLEIIEYLDSLEKMDFVKCDGMARFCFDFFGVRLPNDLSVTFILMNPNAAWVRNVNERFLVRSKNVVTLDAHHFSSAARKYWRHELLSSGLRGIEVLQALYRSSVLKPLSNYYQGMCLTSIFDVANFFLVEKSFDLKKTDAWKLREALQLSTRYFEIVFPLDSRQSLSADIISLRQTDLSEDLLEEIITRDIGSRGELTYGQIGRVVMIILGSGKPKHDLFERFAEGVSDNNPWKSFIEVLRKECESNDYFAALSHALGETFYINWRTNDFISPDCFFYLVERLLILVLRSKGFFFTKKSSFVEYLISLQSDLKLSASLVMDKKSDLSIINFVFRKIEQCLCDRAATAEWIKQSRIDCKYYFPVLMLKLCVILCLFCLNSDLSIDVVLKHLTIPPIRSQLPREFCEAVLSVKRKKSDVDAIAGALKAIGDPLIIVSSTEKKLKFRCRDAVFVDLRSLTCKDEIMKTLFPVERNVIKSSTAPLTVPSSKTTSKIDSNLSLESFWGHIRELSEAIDTIKNRSDVNLKSHILEKKVEVEEHMSFLTGALSRSSADQDENTTYEITSMIKQLNDIFSSSEASEFDSEAATEFEELLKRFEGVRPQIDALFKQSDRAISEGNDEKKISSKEHAATVNNSTDQAAA